MADHCSAEAATCSQPPGSSFNSPSVVIAATLMAVAPLLLLLIPYFGAGIGWILRTKTDGTRKHLVNLMNEEHKKYLQQRKGSDSPSTTSDSLDENGELKASTDWDGVVGFFHPFWYDSPSK
jgi:alpha-1,2-mannosyltransferase